MADGLPDVDAFAAEVALTITAALAPVLERVAAAEARLSVLGDLRDRVVAVETKAAMPLSADGVDLLRDRVLVLETKAAVPVPSVDLSEVKHRLVALEARPVFALSPEAGIDDLRDRLVTLETRAAGPSVTDMALVDVRERLASVERRVQDDSLLKELGGLRERVAVVEVRPAVPGPAGEPGPSGKDGANGKDGTAGLSFEGVYQEGKSYDLGHLVTWAGSSWHCNEPTTTKPGDGSKAWTLMVKRGRDGRDGHDAPGPLPVVRTQ